MSTPGLVDAWAGIAGARTGDGEFERGETIIRTVSFFGSGEPVILGLTPIRMLSYSTYVVTSEVDRGAKAFARTYASKS